MRYITLPLCTYPRNQEEKLVLTDGGCMPYFNRFRYATPLTLSILLWHSIMHSVRVYYIQLVKLLKLIVTWELQGSALGIKLFCLLR